jgi:hypothetical protein
MIFNYIKHILDNYNKLSNYNLTNVIINLNIILYLRYLTFFKIILINFYIFTF